MINILPKKNDDIAFTRIVSQILNNSIAIFDPDEVYIVQIDHRFDYKWLGFSHKSLGAVGSWRMPKLRIPPFTPEKVIEELYFQKVSGQFKQKKQEPLHIHQFSDDNRFRLIENLTNCGLFVWYSGDTRLNSQASIMVYSVSQDIHNYWFASFINNGNWQIRGTNNTSKTEVQNLIERNLLVSVW